MVVELQDGRAISISLAWFPRLADATPQQREKVRISKSWSIQPASSLGPSSPCRSKGIDQRIPSGSAANGPHKQTECKHAVPNWATRIPLALRNPDMRICVNFVFNTMGNLIEYCMPSTHDDPQYC